jgi:hypothetical protein
MNTEWDRGSDVLVATSRVAYLQRHPLPAYPPLPLVEWRGPSQTIRTSGPAHPVGGRFARKVRRFTAWQVDRERKAHLEAHCSHHRARRTSFV